MIYYKIKNKRMKKDLKLMLDKLNLPEEVINEIVILHSLGVSVEDLKYLLEIRLSEY